MAHATFSQKNLRSDERGVIFVECLIAYLPCLLFALAVWQLVELCAGQLVVQRAANAAARAAVVTLPDNPKLYASEDEKQTDIELAASLVLVSDPHFISKPAVTLNGTDSFLELNDTPRMADDVRLLDKIMYWANISRPATAAGYVLAGSSERGLIHEPIVATVQADFECYFPWVNVVCGGERRRLTGSAMLPFQGAPYNYTSEY
jgi:hypothetical protein